MLFACCLEDVSKVPFHESITPRSSPFGQLYANGPAFERRPELVVTPVIHLHVQPASLDLPPPLEILKRPRSDTKKHAQVTGMLESSITA